MENRQGYFPNSALDGQCVNVKAPTTTSTMTTAKAKPTYSPKSPSSSNAIDDTSVVGAIAGGGAGLLILVYIISTRMRRKSQRALHDRQPLAPRAPSSANPTYAGRAVGGTEDTDPSDTKPVLSPASDPTSERRRILVLSENQDDDC